MNWEAVGSFAELVSAAAVVASLVYLARQIGQNTSALHAASVVSYRQLNAEFAHVLKVPEMTSAYLRGLAEYPALDPIDRVRFESLMVTLFNQYEASWFNERLQSVPRDFTPPMKSMLYHLRQPGAAEWWRRLGPALFSPAFVAYVAQVQTENAA
jgi:hypothetical protein